MDTYKETFETWDKVAKLYQDKFMNLNLYDDSYDIFCDQIIKVNSSILEIGCGPGNITKYLLTKRPDFNIQAIDIAPNMIELAKINNPGANFKVMDSRAIEKIETKFDGIICGFCIPYLSKSDCLKLILDCKNLLSDNGSLYISFVEGDYNKSGYLTGSSGDRTCFYYHTIENLMKELNDNNFGNIKLFHKNYPKNNGSEEIHTIIIVRKQAVFLNVKAV